MKTVLMILCKGFEEIEASAFSDIMGWSREHGTTPVALVTAGLHPEIASVWGTVVKPSALLQELNPADFDALVQNTPVVRHEHIVTSTGPSTAMDVAFTLLEMLTDANNVAAVKKYMGFS